MQLALVFGAASRQLARVLAPARAASTLHGPLLLAVPAIRKNLTSLLRWARADEHTQLILLFSAPGRSSSRTGLQCLARLQFSVHEAKRCVFPEK